MLVGCVSGRIFYFRNITQFSRGTNHVVIQRSFILLGSGSRRIFCFRNITQFSHGTNQAMLGFLSWSKFSLFSPSCLPFLQAGKAVCRY